MDQRRGGDGTQRAAIMQGWATRGRDIHVGFDLGKIRRPDYYVRKGSSNFQPWTIRFLWEIHKVATRQSATPFWENLVRTCPFLPTPSATPSDPCVRRCIIHVRPTCSNLFTTVITIICRPSRFGHRQSRTHDPAGFPSRMSHNANRAVWGRVRGPSQQPETALSAPESTVGH